MIRGEARNQLSEMFVESLTRRDPGADEAAVAKERHKPLRSPLTVAVIATVQPGHKIPEIEQVLSAGAAAMNILNAAHALGYGAKWVTGANCYEAEFLRRFGLATTDRHLGFIHIGTALRLPETERPDPADFTVEWSPLNA